MIDSSVSTIFREICLRIARADLSIGGRSQGRFGHPRHLKRARILGIPGAVCFGLLACSSNVPSQRTAGAPNDIRLAPTEAFRFEKWEPETRSPRDASVGPPLERLQKLCGRTDAALNAVADRLARDEHFGSRPDDLDRLAFALRAAGSPYVWPRAWSLRTSEKQPELEILLPRFEHWLESFNDGGQRRCGISRAVGQTGTLYAAVVSDVFADLVKPLPTRVRTGQWLQLQVLLLADASEAKVILEGPRDEPIVVPASIEQREVRSNIPMSGPGPWLVQVLATMDTGPRPVLEAEVFVDEEPPKQLELRSAPGESASGQVGNATEALYGMLNAARIESGRKALAREPRLDQLALEHASAMLAAGRIGHDVGDGSPKGRLENAGIFAALAGENVAHAADAIRAHRALWASPSHRSNILHRGFRNVGLGVVRGPDNTVWACELFAALD